MLQAIIKKGKVQAIEVPAPNVSAGSLLIKVVNSCISAGTELSSMKTSGFAVIKQALEQPDLLRKAINFAKTQGIAKTLHRIRGTLEDGKPTGYSIAGVVIGIGEGVDGFSAGDRVAAAGAGYANHAEFVDVPKNLVVRMPHGLDFAKASTVALGSIAMQGVRRCDLRLGEFCVVFGTGILGLLSVQLLKLSGVRVIAVDLDMNRLTLAKELGAEVILNPSQTDVVRDVLAVTGDHGTDAVLFTASTSSNEPLSQSFQMCRRKGRVVLVGVSGMEMKREDMYEKEIDFLISTSYGPGRYDRKYEEKGLDYPYGYVRWTENRNMAEYLRLVATGAVQLEKLINAVYSIGDVERAFRDLSDPTSRPIIAVLDYGPWEESLKVDRSWQTITIAQRPAKRERIGVALVGAGSFATGVHLPNLSRLRKYYDLRAVMSRTGHKAKAVAERFGAAYATTDFDAILNDPDVELVMITTRHDSHAELTLSALEAGKHVFVEKPLATNQEELSRIVSFYEKMNGKESPLLMVGFNRRFSPFAQTIKRHTDQRKNPLFIHYRMNAGYYAPDHWVHEAGGRIVGEACHIIDLMTFFTGSTVEDISAKSLNPNTGLIGRTDNRSIQLVYGDGSLCTIEYFAVGNTSFPKEYMEMHFDAKTIVMDDYRTVELYGVEGENKSVKEANKGHSEELVALAKGIADGEWPIEYWDMMQTTTVSLQIT